VSQPDEAWFSALGKPLGDAEHAEIDAYLSGLGMASAVHTVSSWREAFEICTRPAEAWWNAEEDERRRLERNACLSPRDPKWLRLNETLHGAAAVAAAQAGGADAALIRAAAGAASYAAYQARLARAAGAGRSGCTKGDLPSSDERC
jgi:hypothetical protein